MGMFAGEYRYLKVRGKDEKGFYKIIEHEVVGEDNCSCHPETCCCADNSYRFFTIAWNVCFVRNIISKR